MLYKHFRGAKGSYLIGRLTYSKKQHLAAEHWGLISIYAESHIHCVKNCQTHLPYLPNSSTNSTFLGKNQARTQYLDMKNACSLVAQRFWKIFMKRVCIHYKNRLLRACSALSLLLEALASNISIYVFYSTVLFTNCCTIDGLFSRYLGWLFTVSFWTLLDISCMLKPRP